MRNQKASMRRTKLALKQLESGRKFSRKSKKIYGFMDKYENSLKLAFMKNKVKKVIEWNIN